MRTHGLSASKDGTFATWRAMHQRCSNPKCGSYPDYGGRGITVAPEWATFVRFLSDMGMKPPGLTLDRIENELGYSKQNCRWTTTEEQSQNRRCTRLNPAIVRTMRALWSSGTKGDAIARQFGVSIGTVSMVVNRHTWKNVE